MIFANRIEAGEQLAEAVAALGLADPVVLALPRGGVPVAAQVAKRLGAPLDLLMVCKIGVPGNPELAAGAVVDGAAHQVVLNEDILRHLRLTEADFAETITRELAVIEERRKLYLKDRAPMALAGRNVVVVDDGIATGATVKAALKGLALLDPASVTLAVPVAPSDTRDALAKMVDRMIVLDTPKPFHAVGQAYARFGQVSDTEVTDLLRT